MCEPWVNLLSPYAKTTTAGLQENEEPSQHHEGFVIQISCLQNQDKIFVVPKTVLMRSSQKVIAHKALKEMKSP